MDPAAEYARLVGEGARLGADAGFAGMSKLFADKAIWRSYDWLIRLSQKSLAGAVAVDIGCKYGHVLPLFLARGARAAMGIDVEPGYLDQGRRVLGSIYPSLEFARSDRGYLPLAPGSVDFVMVNEVISHVNPMYLETLYAEIARILRPGGVVVISDGNNWANAEARQDLRNVWEAWEHGPAGRNTGRDIVSESYLELRRQVVRARHPTLPEDRVDYVARNTFGLFAGLLDEVIDEYVRTGKLVERPFRPGLFPTNPRESGVVMERAFHPVQVELALAGYGIRARQVIETPRVDRSDLKGRLLNVYLDWRHRLRCWRDYESVRGAAWGFQVVGIKE
jgi:SAM-dependent methyltransferase